MAIMLSKTCALLDSKLSIVFSITEFSVIVFNATRQLAGVMAIVSLRRTC